MASSLKKGVALLATDCNTQWETFHFSDASKIKRNVYTHGRKAWEDFMLLIKSAEDRQCTVKLQLATLDEEQDLKGWEDDLSDRDQKKMKAVEDQAMLERMADHLGDVYGERPTIPWWARAEARVPDYYD